MLQSGANCWVLSGGGARLGPRGSRSFRSFRRGCNGGCESPVEGVKSWFTSVRSTCRTCLQSYHDHDRSLDRFCWVGRPTSGGNSVVVRVVQDVLLPFVFSPSSAALSVVMKAQFGGTQYPSALCLNLSSTQAPTIIL